MKDHIRDPSDNNNRCASDGGEGYGWMTLKMPFGYTAGRTTIGSTECLCVSDQALFKSGQKREGEEEAVAEGEATAPLAFLLVGNLDSTISRGKTSLDATRKLVLSTNERCLS